MTLKKGEGYFKLKKEEVYNMTLRKERVTIGH